MKGSTTTAISRGDLTWCWKFKRLGEVVQGFGTKMLVAVALSGIILMRCPSMNWQTPAAPGIGSVRESFTPCAVMARRPLSEQAFLKSIARPHSLSVYLFGTALI